MSDQGVTIKEGGPPITMSDIEDIERYLGHNLPEDYRRFLLQHNGGRVSPSEVLTGDSIYPLKHVNYLYGVKDDIESCTLRCSHYGMRERSRPELLPIGNDGGPDLFCLVLFGPDQGKIVFWDCREMWLRPPPDPLDVYPVADSFTDFLNSLFDHDPLADEPA